MSCDDDSVEDLWDYEAPKIFKSPKQNEQKQQAQVVSSGRGRKRKKNVVLHPTVVVLSDLEDSDTDAARPASNAVSRRTHKNTPTTAHGALIDNTHTPNPTEAEHIHVLGGVASSIPAVHAAQVAPYSASPAYAPNSRASYYATPHTHPSQGPSSYAPRSKPPAAQHLNPDLKKQLEETRELVCNIQQGTHLIPAHTYAAEHVHAGHVEQARVHAAAQPTPQPHGHTPTVGGNKGKRIRITLEWGEDQEQTFLFYEKEQLQKLFDAFKKTALAKGWGDAKALDAVQFKFDEDVLLGDTTADGMGIEDEDVIDVVGL